MKAHGGGGKITPLQLSMEAKVWLEIWENTPKSTESLLPATYCLFTALELYMKAYLVFKNSKYADIDKLKRLQHNFGHIYQEITAVESNKLTQEIQTQIKKYDLRSMALDKLKYPENGRVWLIARGLEKREHTLHDIFQNISLEISTKHHQWLNVTYPKRTELSAMIQIGYKGNPKKLDLKALSEACSECLPSKIIISEHYAYPWSHELIPFRTCRVCQNLFNPNGIRPSTFE